MDPEVILWALPYLAVAGIFYLIYLWKTSRGKKLFAQATDGAGAKSPGEAVRLLKEALWNANEKPDLEHSILKELATHYQCQHIAFDNQDYAILIGQFQELSKKGSTKAMGEIHKVQALKKRIIDRMPDIP